MKFSSLPHSLYLLFLFPSFSEDAISKQTVLLLFFHRNFSSLSSELQWHDSIIWEVGLEQSPCMSLQHLTLARQKQREQGRKHHRLIHNGQRFHFLNKLMSGYSLALVQSGINPMTTCSPDMPFSSGCVLGALDSRALALLPSSTDKAWKDKAASPKMQVKLKSEQSIKIFLRRGDLVLLQLFFFNATFYEYTFPKECLFIVQK